MTELPTPHPGQNRRILVVDGDPATHAAYREVLAAGATAPGTVDSLAGATGVRFEVQTATSGEAGCELARAATADRHPFALAFVGRCAADGGDGLATVERLWSEFHDLQIVICTAVSNAGWEQEVQRLGWTDRLLVLKTPVDPVEVRHIACALTHNWNLQQQALSMLDRLTERVRMRTSQLERAHDELVDVNIALSAAKSAAESASRAKTMFLANISHELRTPITAIIGYAEELQAGLDDSGTIDGANEGLETIRRNARHLVGIVGDLLDTAKLEAGKLTVERIPCEPLCVVDEVVRFLRPRAATKGLTIAVEFSSPMPTAIVSDPLRLRQIFVNLIENAIKFSADGTIRVSLDLQADEPRFVAAVRDEGCGMSAEVRQRLFRPFEQADTSTTRRYGGTGLGLAVSRQLAELLGGGLTVETEPDVGSCFELKVATGPLTGVELVDAPAAAPAAPPERPTIRPSEATAGLRVLLAEDGPDNQRLISSILRRAGILTEVAGNGAECVERALAGDTSFDLIVMDVQMPVMDGLTATAMLREAGCMLPIVALTASAMLSDRRACLQAGCDDFLTKPIDRKALVDTVERLAGRTV